MDRPDGNIVTREIRYSPLPSQKRFHQSRARFKGFSGPIGSGKSQALCQEALKLSYLNAGRTGLLGAPTYPMLRDATQSTFLSILEENGIPYDLNKSEHSLRLADTGSTILFRAVEEFERLRGTNLAWFGLDELTYTSRESWLRLQGRLRDPKSTRLAGFAVWTPKGFDWVYEHFIANRPEDVDVVLAAPYENRFLLDAIPDFYDRLRHSYDDRFFQQEVLGAYLNRASNLVYDQFDRNSNVREATHDRDARLYWSMDFNVNPMSSIVAQRVDGVIHVLDELFLPNSTTATACSEFTRRFHGHRGTVIVTGDASANSRKTTGLSDIQVVKEHFHTFWTQQPVLSFPRSNPPVKDRINAVNSALKSAAGDVHLFIDPRCKELLKDFDQVSYHDNSFELDKEKDPRRTHLSDALGYLICSGKRPAGEQIGRLF